MAFGTDGLGPLGAINGPLGTAVQFRSFRSWFEPMDAVDLIASYSSPLTGKRIVPRSAEVAAEEAQRGVSRSDYDVPTGSFAFQAPGLVVLPQVTTANGALMDQARLIYLG